MKLFMNANIMKTKFFFICSIVIADPISIVTYELVHFLHVCSFILLKHLVRVEYHFNISSDNDGKYILYTNNLEFIIKNVRSSTSHKKTSSLRLSFREFKKILLNTFIYQKISIKIYIYTNIMNT